MGSKYGIDIEVSPAGAVSGSRTAKRSLQEVEQAADKAQGSIGGLSTRMLAVAATAAAVATAIGAASREIANQADRVDRLNVRLSRHTSTIGETVGIYSELRDISTATRTSLQDNIALFDRFAAIGPELGKSNEEITAFVEQLVKLGTLSGSSAEEQANALRQLAQGLAAGTLRAEEFNSIVEQAPEILRVVARESGRTFGQLRQDMLDGKITAELLFESIAKGADTTDAQFANFKATSDELFTTAAQLARDAAAALGEVSGAQAAWNTTAQFTVEIMGNLARTLDSMRDTPKTIDGLALRMGDLRSELTDLQRIQAEQTSKFGGVGIVDALLGKSSPEARIAEVQEELKKLEKVYADARGLAPPGPADDKPAKAAIVDPTAGKALEALKQQAELAKLSGEARARLAAIQKLGTAATAEERAEAEQLATQIYRLDEAQKAATKSASEQAKSAEEVKRQQEANVATVAKLREELTQAALSGGELAQRQAEMSLNQYATPEQVQQVRDLAAAISDLEAKKKAEQEFTQLTQQLEDPIAKLERERAERLAIIQTYEQLETDSHAQAEALRAETERQYQEQRMAAMEEAYRQQSWGNELVMNSIDALGAASTNVISGLLSGTMSVKDAMQQFANIVLNSVVGAFVDLGIEYIKNQVLASTAQATQLAMAAATGPAIAAAYAPAAAMASLASFGANAAPATAGIASTVAASSALALAGFEQGGYTGNVGTSQVAGVVHGQEYVMNAEATRRIGVGNLERMSSGGGMQPRISITNNYANGVEVTTKQLSEGDVEIIVDRRMAEQMPDMMTAELSNPYSDSRAVLSSSYSIQRNTVR